jgi:hypothetical protein
VVLEGIERAKRLAAFYEIAVAERCATGDGVQTISGRKAGGTGTPHQDGTTYPVIVASKDLRAIEKCPDWLLPQIHI